MTQTLSVEAALKSRQSEVLTKALLRATQALGLSQKELARTVGVSESTVSRLVDGKTLLEADKKEGELALLLLRVFRSLDTLVGGSDEKVKAWFTSPNAHLGGTPKEQVQTAVGLVQVAHYLDAMRGKL
jgi:predicted transcriptional regulator